MSRIYELPMARNYVSHWGLQEAVRELLQNAIDSDDPLEYSVVDHTLTITSRYTTLPASTLVLGQTSKAGVDAKIGNFGEGFKLALLVLARLGYPVQVMNGDKLWTPSFVHSEAFGTEVLQIAEVALGGNQGLTFQISGLQHETLVAVLETGEMIPGIEKIDIQIQALAMKLGNMEGVKNFFRRVASVKRAHSVQDLLTFMQKGELPIADDGSVLVYKRLQSTDEAGVFVDCHTSKVKQRVGSHVFMDEKLVDPNRGQDCSNGLHVARRDYLRTFSGDVCVLAKLAPEDVIAVPHNDARKLRAKGYHIVAQLSAADANLVCSNQAMTDTVLLGNAVAGNHVGILETVEITGQKGSGLVFTGFDTAVPVVLNETVQAQSLDTIEQKAQEGSTVDAAKLAKQVTANRKSIRQLKAEELLFAVGRANFAGDQMKAAKALLDYKKAAKVSWDKLGITEKEMTRVLDIADGKADLKVMPATKAVKAKPVKQADPSRVVNKVETGLGTPKQRIRDLLDKGLTSVGVAQAIMKLKKESKKSWDKLGVSSDELGKLMDLIDL